MVVELRRDEIQLVDLNYVLLNVTSIYLILLLWKSSERKNYIYVQIHIPFYSRPCLGLSP